MTILSRYLTLEIIKVFLFVVLAVVTIYLSVDFVEKIDDFMDAGLPTERVVRYFQFKTPFIVAQITPVGLLLSVLIVLGLMNKNLEIIALRAGGISVYALVRPILGLALLLSVGLFYLAEIIVPVTITEANRIVTEEVDKKTVHASKKSNIWTKGHRTISHITYFDPGQQTVFGVTLNYFGAEFQLERRIDARRGFYRKGVWELQEVMEQIWSPEEPTYRIQFHETLETQLELTPEELKKGVKQSEEMSFTQLLAHIRDIETEGYDARSYRVDLNAKLSFPFICVILSALGVGIAVRWSKNLNISVSVAAGIGMVFSYWALYSFCLSLGYGGILPPLVAAWTVNIIFGCVAAFLLLTAE